MPFTHAIRHVDLISIAGTARVRTTASQCWLAARVPNNVSLTTQLLHKGQAGRSEVAHMHTDRQTVASLRWLTCTRTDRSRSKEATHAQTQGDMPAGLKRRTYIQTDLSDPCWPAHMHQDRCQHVCIDAHAHRQICGCLLTSTQTPTCLQRCTCAQTDLWALAEQSDQG